MAIIKIFQQLCKNRLNDVMMEYKKNVQKYWNRP